MTPKTIVFFLPLLTSGGAERVTINILNQLDIDKYTIHLILGTLEGTGRHLLPSHIKVHNLNSPRTLFSVVKLRKKISQINPDIIFSSLNRAHIALNLSLFAKRNRPKVIMRIPSSPKLIAKYNEMGKGFKFLLNQALANADKIIVQTPEMLEEVNIYHKINKDKIKIFLNPIDTKDIDKKSQEPCTLLDKQKINVIASGRLQQEKGYDILIEAFKEVYTQNKRFRLFIIGEDVLGEQKKYEAQINELKLDGVVSFLGFQTNPYKFYQQSDLFVLSSRREGLPNTVLENLYLQKPIVATTCIPFMHTLIENGKNGLLVPVEDSQALANALLNFKTLDSKYQTITFNSQSVNEIFS